MQLLSDVQRLLAPARPPPAAAGQQGYGAYALRGQQRGPEAAGLAAREEAAKRTRSHMAMP